MKWEYRIVSVELFPDIMALLGDDGWELVSVNDNAAHFKRPKENNVKIEHITDEVAERFRDAIGGLSPRSKKLKIPLLIFLNLFKMALLFIIGMGVTKQMLKDL